MKNDVKIHHMVRKAAKRWSEFYGISIEPSYGIWGGYIVDQTQVNTLAELHAYCKRLLGQRS